ncbi:hypothetical protein WJX77_011576 [Trebouxia sp. C0004]
MFSQFRKVPEAKFLDPLPDGAPPASGPSWMSLPYCLSKLKVPSAQACAAQSAAVASFMLGQYMGALQSFPKRGVSSVGQAHDMAVLADTVGHPRQACLHEALQQELKKHTAWSQGLKLSLQRLCTAYQDSGTNSCEWVLASQEVHAMMQTKPNNFQISLDVFPESVFQDASEWFDAACWSQECKHADKSVDKSDSAFIMLFCKEVAKQSTISKPHQSFLYICAEVMCHDAERATHAECFSECLTLGVIQAGNNTKNDHHKFLSGMVGLPA